MAFSFADLKRSQANLDEIAAEANKLNSKGKFQRDERFWLPVQDKGGNASAIIRFLPGPGEEMKVPFVRKFSYGFKGKGGWYIQASPSTLDLPDPVMEYNSELWATNDPEKQAIAKKQKRRLGFIANILVVKHKARPEDEGKVFLYEFGKKIYDKLNGKMNPKDEDTKKINPFCPFNGLNFRLRISKNDGGMNNYDDCEFDFPSAIGDDAEIERIWKQTYSLKAEVAPDKFLPYDQLKAKFYKAIGLTGATTNNRPQHDDEDETPQLDNASEGRTRDAPASNSPLAGLDVEMPPSGDDDGDMEWFKNLAKK